MPRSSAISSLMAHKVSKPQLLVYVEQTFAQADEDGDGLLSLEELERFLLLLCHPSSRPHG